MLGLPILSPHSGPRGSFTSRPGRTGPRISTRSSTSWTSGSTLVPATPRFSRPTIASDGPPIGIWKAPTNTAMFKIMGSTAFANLARAVWMIGEDLDDKDIRLMLPVKMNVAKPAPGMKFQIVEPGQLEWLGTTSTTANDAFTEQAGRPGPRPEKLEVAMAWLRAQYPTGVNVMSASDLRYQAEDQGISYSTLKRARAELGLESWKEKAFGGRVTWGWDKP